MAASASNFPANTWIQYALTWTSGGATTLYANGVALGTNTNTAPINTGQPTILGGSVQNSQTFAGRLDEFRVSNVLRSADWITTEYNSQFSPASFFTLGALQ